MDSRIKLAEKQSREWASAVSNDYDHESPKWANDLARQQKEERDALLTAEPEPSEDVRELTRAILLKYRTRTEYDVSEASREIAAYASQVADKREEELRAVVKDAVRFLRWAGYDKTDKELRMISRLDKALAATEPKPSAKEN